MKLAAFDFDLPDEAIALRPASPRDSARLLEISAQGHLSDRHVRDLSERLGAGDVLVLNETKVIPAALKAIRKARPVGGGGDVSISVNLHQKLSENGWRAFVRPAKRLRQGDIIYFAPDLEAKVLEKQDGGEVALEFNLTGADLNASFAKHGSPPLPPYIARQRPVDGQDIFDYQTLYAARPGSVAAPTAGLHFTDRLLGNLVDKGIEIAKITLHVGAGTFLPVKADNVRDHKMHSEWFSINAQTRDQINQAKRSGRRIIAVGTTSLRALESASANGSLVAGNNETKIFITPGYNFKIVDGLMTNFHLPKSTLFMLVCAMAGTERMQDAYRHAIRVGYRFYSYGDSSLIWRRK